MTTVSDKLSQLFNIKSQLKAALARKGGAINDNTPFTEYPSVVDGLNTIPAETPRNKWAPNSTWWDIETILQNDATDGYISKYAVLLDDTMPSISLTGANAYRTSDGQFYTADCTHTWDTTRDKECNDGYKTRYVIYYFTTRFPVNKVVNIEHLNQLFIVFDMDVVMISDYIDPSYISTLYYFNIQNDTTKYNFMWIRPTPNLQGIRMVNNHKFFGTNSFNTNFTYNQQWSSTNGQLKYNRCFLREIPELYHPRTEQSPVYATARAIRATVTMYYYVSTVTLHLTAQNKPMYDEIQNFSADSYYYIQPHYIIETLNIIGELPNTSPYYYSNTTAKIRFGFIYDGSTGKTYNLSPLKNINITGEHLQWEWVNLSVYPYLTRQSLLNIINAVQDETGGTNRTMTVNQYQYDKLTTSDRTFLAEKNWTLSLVSI